MQQFIVGENEAGQRLERFLSKYFKEASKGFLFKMLRKKNITLNQKKADGSERLCQGDCIQFFFSEDTCLHFRGMEKKQEKYARLPYIKAFEELGGIDIIFENEHVLLLNKPAGILTQKAAAGDSSLNEWLIGYLLTNNKMGVNQLATFRPSVCNRLDRNTSGLVICGKSLAGSRMMSELIRERKVRKFYRTLVKGRIEHPAHVRGYLKKDSRTNKVMLKEVLSSSDDGFEPIETRYEPLYYRSGYTCLEVELITGKPHQLRAHLSHLNHPILGDPKYGDREFNHQILGHQKNRGQLLHAFRLEFPALEAPFEDLSERSFIAPWPKIFQEIQGRQI